MQNYRGLFRDGLAYLIFGFINKLLPFLALPILTLYLTTSELGRVTLFQSIYQFLLPLLAFGSLGLLSVDIIKRPPAEVSSVVRQTMWIQFISTVFLLTIGLCFGGQITAFTELSLYLILLLPFACMGGSLVNFLSVVLQMTRRVKSFVVLQFSGVFLELILIVIFVVLLSLKSEGRVMSIVIAMVLVGGCSCIYLIRNHGRPCLTDLISVARLVKLSAPLLVYELAFLAVLITDKFVMRSMHGFSALGIYGVGLQFGLVIYLFESSLLRAWMPWFFSAKHSGTINDRTRISRYSWVYIAILAAVTLFWMAVSGILLKSFVAPEFESAESFIPWISVGFLFAGTYKLVAQHLFYEKDVVSLMKCAIFVALINVPLTIFMSCLYGPVGVAQATMLSYFFACVVVAIFVWRSRREVEVN